MNTIPFKRFVDEFVRDTNFNQNQYLIYVGIGTAANISNKNVNVIGDKDYHQFPPYIQSIKARYPHLTTHLIQIDPTLTVPPYCVADNNLYVNQDYNNVYFNQGDNIHVYSFNELVHYFDGDNFSKKSIDIVDDLRKLNRFTIDNNHLMFVHDFSGRDTYELAFKFDKELNGHISNVVYDITNRFKGSCNVDLLDPIYWYPVTYNRGIVRILNPYSLPYDQIIPVYRVTRDLEYKKILLSMIKVKITLFFDTYCNIYRRFYMFRKSMNDNFTKEECLDFLKTIRSVDFRYSSDLVDPCITYKELTDENVKKYGDINYEYLTWIVETIKQSTTIQLAQLVSIFANDQMNVVNDLMSRFEKDPYGWKNDTEKFITVSLNNQGLAIANVVVNNSYL